MKATELIRACYSCVEVPVLERSLSGGYQLFCRACYCGEGGAVTRDTAAETIADWNELQEERADPEPRRLHGIDQWTLVSLALTDDRYEFSRKAFPNEPDARAAFERAREHAQAQGGSYELWSLDGLLQDSCSHFCPND